MDAWGNYEGQTGHLGPRSQLVCKQNPVDKTKQSKDVTDWTDEEANLWMHEMDIQG